MRKVKSKEPKTGMAIEGFYRVNIVDPDGTIKGDSGWKHNIIPTAGLTNYISYLFAGSAGSSRVGFMQLGSLVSSLATNDTILAGEYNKSLMASLGATQYTARTVATNADTVRFLATFVSGSIISATNQTIGCIGLYAATTSTNSVFCGGSFTASTLGSNQAINCSYSVLFLASAS